MLRFIGVTAHALGKLFVVGEEREPAKAFSQLMRGQRCEFGCLCHVGNYCGTG